MKRKTSQKRRAGTPVRSKGWLDSCDYCASQEDGGHYCLLHSRQMKNMDMLRCSDWTPNGGVDRPAKAGERGEL